MADYQSVIPDPLAEENLQTESVDPNASAEAGKIYGLTPEEIWRLGEKLKTQDTAVLQGIADYMRKNPKAIKEAYKNMPLTQRIAGGLPSVTKSVEDAKLVGASARLSPEERLKAIVQGGLVEGTRISTGNTPQQEVARQKGEESSREAEQRALEQILSMARGEQPQDNSAQFAAIMSGVGGDYGITKALSELRAEGKSFSDLSEKQQEVLFEQMGIINRADKTFANAKFNEYERYNTLLEEKKQSYNKAIEEVKKNMSSISTKRDAIRKKIDEHDVDPMSIIRDPGNKIMAAIAVILGGIGQGLAGGDNQALNTLYKVIEENANRQAAELNKMQGREAGLTNQLQEYRLAMQDEQAAMAAFRQDQLHAIEMKITQLAEKNGISKSDANLVIAKQELQRKQAEENLKIKEGMFVSQSQYAQIKLAAAQNRASIAMATLASGPKPDKDMEELAVGLQDLSDLAAAYEKDIAETGMYGAGTGMWEWFKEKASVAGPIIGIDEYTSPRTVFVKMSRPKLVSIGKGQWRGERFTDTDTKTWVEQIDLNDTPEATRELIGFIRKAFINRISKKELLQRMKSRNFSFEKPAIK